MRVCFFNATDTIPTQTGVLSVKIIDLCDASNAVSSMQALREGLAEDLENIENCIRELAQSPLAT